MQLTMNQSRGLGDVDSSLDLPSPMEMARVRRDLMSQREMADLLGVDPAQLSRFERGKGSMAYERIRRYAHVLALRLAGSQPHRFLVERIAQRGPLLELSMADRLDHAIEGMVAHQTGQLPVRDASGDPVGVLTEVALCEALVDAEPQAALMRRVGELRIEPLDVVGPGDPFAKVAALLASHWLVRVEDEQGGTLGYASRRDLFRLVLGRSGLG